MPLLSSHRSDLSRTIEETEGARSYQLTTVRPWSMLELNFLLFSCSTAMASQGYPWGVNIHSNEGQMLGGPKSCKRDQEPYANIK